MVIVAISGSHGAGKTTAAKSLVKKFKLRYVYAGAVFRRLAEEKGMSIEEFSRYAERHPDIDRTIDQRTTDAARKGNVLIDARLAGWMAEKADVKVLLTAPLEARARRIADREKRDYEKVLRETTAREKSEAKRFKKLYHIDVNDHSPFDLVLNTERLSIRETVEILETVVTSVMKRRH